MSDTKAAEPVHWRAVLAEEQRPQKSNGATHVVGFRDRRSAESWIASELDFGGWTYTLEPLYAAPQPQAAPPAVEPDLPPDATWHAKIIAFAPELPPLPSERVLRSLSSERPADPPYLVTGYTAADLRMVQCEAWEAAVAFVEGSPTPAVERDALRYRWLRSRGFDFDSYGLYWQWTFSRLGRRGQFAPELYAERLDAAIDAAIANQAPGEPT